jgi:nitrogen fixation NifU-like protein
MRYSETLIDHFLSPRNAGMMRDPDGTGVDEYEGCGDQARVFLRVHDGRAVDVRFQAYGCGPTIAAASAASELIQGRPLADLAHLKAREVEDALDGLPEDRRHAADLVAGAVRAAARDALGRRAAGA